MTHTQERMTCSRVILALYKGLGSGQLGPKTNRPRTTRPIKKSAQDSSAQVVPISEDNSAQIAQTAEDHSAHKNQTRHLLMY